MRMMRRIVGLLIEDCVDGDCGLASLAIADDQLSLATANWDQAVDSLQASGPAQGCLASLASVWTALLVNCMNASKHELCTCKNLHPICHGLVHALPGNDARSLRTGTLRPLCGALSKLTNPLQKAKRSTITQFAWTLGRNVLGP